MRERNFPPAAPQTWFVAERKILILSEVEGRTIAFQLIGGS